MFDRISPVYDDEPADDGGPDPAAGAGSRSALSRPGDRVLDALAAARGDPRRAQRGRKRDGGRLLRAHARARAAQVRGDRVGSRRRACSFLSGRELRPPWDGRLRDPQRRRAPQGLVELARVLLPGGPAACLEITRPRGCCAPSSPSGSTGSCRWPGSCPGRLGLHLLAGERAPFPWPGDLADAMHQAGYTEIARRLLGGGIVALYTATKRFE